jgi:hypothetical protein
MPTKRRGGFRSPELRGTLGTLLRTTTGVVRDALERGAREGRARLDDARASRRRNDALADLGELVLDLIRRGEIDLAELPEARDLVRLLDELDAEPDEPAPPEPRRISTRRTAAAPPSSPARRRPDAPDADDDGTVSSGLTDRPSRPTTPARPRHADSPTTRAPTKPIKGLWRPTFDESPTAPDRPDPKRPAPPRKGGITFDDDDLADYMHPDDVPPKPRDPSDGDP